MRTASRIPGKPSTIPGDPGRISPCAAGPGQDKGAAFHLAVINIGLPVLIVILSD